MAIDKYIPDEDYGISYDEYNEIHSKTPEKLTPEGMTKDVVEKNTVKDTVEESAEAAAPADSAAQISETTTIEGQMNEIAGSNPSIASKFSAGGMMQMGLTMLAKQFGISGRTAAILISVLGSAGVGAFLFGSSPNTTTYVETYDNCIVDGNLMVYNEKYEDPTQEEKDGMARAMYHILASPEITRRWVDDDDCKTSTGLYWFPKLRDDPEEEGEENTDENAQQQPAENTEGEGESEDLKGTSKAFSTEAIIGMISCAEAESGVQPDSYEYNYGVGPKDNEADQDSILSTFHHYNWDIYCEQMFTKGDINYNEDAYKYVNRVSGEEHYYPGMGLWGWTGPLAYDLQEFCDTFEDPWEMNGDGHNDAMYTMAGQLAFLLHSEDYFKYAKCDKFPHAGEEKTTAGTLKTFKVKVPNAGSIEGQFGEIANTLGVDISGVNDMNMYELCEKMREIETAWESAWINYTTKEQLEELEKIREKWDEKVDSCLQEETVTVKEWAALNQVYYEVHYWCYFPEKKVDEFEKYPKSKYDTGNTDPFSDAKRLKINFSGENNTNEINPDDLSYVDYYLDADLHEDEDEEEEQPYGPPVTPPWLEESEEQESTLLIPSLDPIIITNGVKADGSTESVKKCWGLDGKPKRIESQVPVFLDFGAFDSKADDKDRQTIDASNDYMRIWNSDEKDIWIWDLHVEVIARDQYGRIIKRVSDTENDKYWQYLCESKPDSTKVENGKEDSWGKPVSKGNNGYESDYECVEGQGYEKAESRSDDNEQHQKVTEIKKDDYICYDSRVWTDEEFDKWFDLFNSTWQADWRQTYTPLFTQLHAMYLPLFGEPAATYLARKEAGVEAEKAADKAGYLHVENDPEKFSEKLWKELAFDVLGDIGDPNNPDIDEASDNDATSAGGLASESLAKDFFEYFVFGKNAGDGDYDQDQLNLHIGAASKYWEQFLGTQEDWYPDDEKKLDDDSEKVNKFPIEWSWLPNDGIAELVANLWDPDLDTKDHNNSRLSDMKKENAQRHCGVKVNTDTIADTAVALSWPQGHPELATYSTILLETGDEAGGSAGDRHYILRLCTELYVAVKDLVMPEENPQNKDPDVEYGGVTLYSSCDRGAMTIARSSGGDPCFYHFLGGDDESGQGQGEGQETDPNTDQTQEQGAKEPYDGQLDYCEKSTIWYDILNHKIVFEDEDEENQDESSEDGSEESSEDDHDTWDGKDHKRKNENPDEEEEAGNGEEAGEGEEGTTPETPETTPEESDTGEDSKWKTIKTKEDLDKLEPGDFLISGEHIMVFVGADAVYEKYPSMGWDIFCDKDAKDGKKDGKCKGMEYEEWFKKEFARYSVAHSSHGTPNEVKDEGNETSRGLMVQCVAANAEYKSYGVSDYQWLLKGEGAAGGSGEGYRAFRCLNADLASVGPKWAVNSKWITLRNLPKGEVRDGMYINKIHAEEGAHRGVLKSEEEDGEGDAGDADETV